VQRLFSWQLSVLLFAGITAGAQVNNSNQGGQSPDSPPAENATPPGDGQATTTQPTISPGITVTGTTPRAEPPPPKLAPDQFTNCYAMSKSTDPEQMDFVAMETCEAQLAVDQRNVINKCINRDGKSAPPVIIQACTELLDRNILQGHERFYLFVNRAVAYVAQGDKQHALDDYNTGVKLAPKYAQPYYYRGVFYATQTDVDAALRDLGTALSLNPKLVPALLQRARIHQTQHAIKDEAQAIRLDPKMARAYFLRGAAFGDLGDSPNAVSDVTTAVELDPSLDRYISSNGKTATLTLPPL